ncbi:MAG: molybdenum cofactor biosynthesis protein MoaE [Longimicrobiales bacterium]
MNVHAKVTRDPIDPLALLDRVAQPAAGAAILFIGRVRDHNEGRAVDALRYEAYEPMCEKVLADIAEEAAARVSVDRGPARVAVEHRIGNLSLGEASVIIAVATGHREEAFDIARYVIEQIKQRLPIWKQEHYADGDSGWVAGSRPDP